MVRVVMDADTYSQLSDSSSDIYRLRCISVDIAYSPPQVYYTNVKLSILRQSVARGKNWGRMEGEISERIRNRDQGTAGVDEVGVHSNFYSSAIALVFRSVDRSE